MPAPTGRQPAAGECGRVDVEVAGSLAGIETEPRETLRIDVERCPRPRGRQPAPRERVGIDLELAVLGVVRLPEAEAGQVGGCHGELVVLQ